MERKKWRSSNGDEHLHEPAMVDSPSSNLRPSTEKRGRWEEVAAGKRNPSLGTDAKEGLNRGKER